jgi:hypothetical protein
LDRFRFARGGNNTLINIVDPSAFAKKQIRFPHLHGGINRGLAVYVGQGGVATGISGLRDGSQVMVAPSQLRIGKIGRKIRFATVHYFEQIRIGSGPHALQGGDYFKRFVGGKLKRLPAVCRGDQLHYGFLWPNSKDQAAQAPNHPHHTSANTQTERERPTIKPFFLYHPPNRAGQKTRSDGNRKDISQQSTNQRYYQNKQIERSCCSEKATKIMRTICSTEPRKKQLQQTLKVPKIKKQGPATPMNSPTINQRDSNGCGGAKLLWFSIVQNSQNNAENKQQTDLPLFPLFINQTKQYPRVDTKRKEDDGKQRISFHGGLVYSFEWKQNYGCQCWVLQ